MDLREIALKLTELSGLVAGDAGMEETVAVSQRLVGEAIKAEDGGEYGCHCELEDGERPDECVLDEGRLSDCIFAKGALEKGGRHMCKYWRRMDMKWRT